MTPTPSIPSSYIENLNNDNWEVIFETTVHVAIKSKIDNAELIVNPNEKQKAILVFKKGAYVVLIVGGSPNGPTVNLSWENDKLISQNLQTVTGN